MKTKTLLWIITIIALCSIGCVPKINPSTIPTPPAKTESVIPDFKKVSGGIDSSINSNIKIEEKIKQQKNEVVLQQLTISETISQTEKLKTKVIADETIKEIEVINIINSLKLIETRNLFLEQQNSELDLIRKEQSDLLQTTKIDASTTYQKLINKENEASSLRDQNTFLGRELLKKNGEVELIKKQLSDEKIKSARASVYRNWIIGLSIGFIVWTILKNILMIYLPTTKFRL